MTTTKPVITGTYENFAKLYGKQPEQINLHPSAIYDEDKVIQSALRTVRKIEQVSDDQCDCVSCRKGE